MGVTVAVLLATGLSSAPPTILLEGTDTPVINQAYKAVVLIAVVFALLASPATRAVRWCLIAAIPFFLWNVMALLVTGVDWIGIRSVPSLTSPFLIIAVCSLIPPAQQRCYILLKAASAGIIVSFGISAAGVAADLLPPDTSSRVPVIFALNNQWAVSSVAVLIIAIALTMEGSAKKRVCNMAALLAALSIVGSVIRIYMAAMALIYGLATLAAKRGVFASRAIATVLIGPIALFLFLNKSIGITPGHYFDHVGRVFGVTTNGRIQAWSRLWPYIKASPLIGNGPGFDIKLAKDRPYGYWGLAAHNDYLAIAAGAGWPSVVFFVGGMGTVLIRLCKSRHKIPANLFWPAIGCFLSYFLIAFTDNPVRNPSASYPLLVLVGMVFGQCFESGSVDRACRVGLRLHHFRPHAPPPVVAQVGTNPSTSEPNT